MVETIKVRGLKELNRELKRLPDKLAKKSIRRAVAAGAKLMQKQAKANAPRQSGALRRAIAVRSNSPRGNRNLIRSSVFVRTGGRRTKSARRRGDDPFYWYFQEFGYRAIGNPKRGNRFRGTVRKQRRSRGRKIPGRRFMRSAFRSQSRRALVIFRRTLTTEINSYDAGRS